MAGQRGLKNRARPLLTKTPQPGAPMTAALDYGLSAQTQSIAFGALGTSHTFYWAKRGAAPEIRTSSVDTPVIFTSYTSSSAVGPAEIEMGWVAHPNASAIEATVYVALADTDVPLSLNLYTETLARGSAVTGQSFPVTIVEDMPQSEWSRIIGGNAAPASSDPYYSHLRLGMCKLSIEPTYPANRLLTVKVYGTWNAPSNPSNTSNERNALIMSVSLRDVITPPDPES